MLAERAGLRIHEVPVDWVDDPDSRVDIVRTALDDLRGIVRLGWALLRGRMPLAEVTGRLGRTHRRRCRRADWAPRSRCSAWSGSLSTAAYAVLYLLLRGTLSPFWANGVALVATAVANTAANRRITFGVRGRRRRRAPPAQGLVILAVGLGVTTGRCGCCTRLSRRRPGSPRWSC